MKRRQITSIVLLIVLLLGALAFIQWQRDSYQAGYNSVIGTVDAARAQAHTEGFATFYLHETQTAQQ